MTNEEALKIWLPVISMGVDTMVECKEALNMAIKALEQEPCEDAVSRADTLQSFESYCEKNCQYSKKQRNVMCGACMMGDAIEIVENLPPVTPKPMGCEDCVSRKAVLNYIRDNYRRWFINDDAFMQCVNGIKNIVPVTPKPTECEDAVSRQTVDELSKELVHTTRDKADFLCNFWERLQKLPPVTPKQRLCKDCKFFEYDSVAKVDGIPLIVAHEICNKWGDGCRTSEDGYCFLFKSKMEGMSE